MSNILLSISYVIFFFYKVRNLKNDGLQYFVIFSFNRPNNDNYCVFGWFGWLSTFAVRSTDCRFGCSRRHIFHPLSHTAWKKLFISLKQFQTPLWIIRMFFFGQLWANELPCKNRAFRYPKTSVGRSWEIFGPG